MVTAAFPWEPGREFKHQQGRTSHYPVRLPHRSPGQELLNQALN